MKLWGGATIAGGRGNTASSRFATVGGGDGNTASSSSSSTGDWATVGGGHGNIARDSSTTVGGGSRNTASGAYATVGGGRWNTASGSAATVSGGMRSHARGNYSFAAGYKARAAHDGSFVWSDNSLQAIRLDDPDSLVSTGENQFLIRAAGGVGIGTNSPGNALHVTESINGRAGIISNHVALVENNSAATSDGPDVLALKTSETNPGTATNFITFFDGNDDAVGTIEGTGDGIRLKSGSGDFAEHLERLDPAEKIVPAEVVGVFGGRITKRTNGAERLMVVSDRAIMVGNAPMDDAGAEATEVVALVGQVPVRVRGPVKAGDFIVPSGQGDGTAVSMAPEAMQLNDHAQVIGRAWESSSAQSVKEVNVVVGLDRVGALVNQLQRQQDQIEVLRRNQREQAERLEELEARISAMNSNQK